MKGPESDHERSWRSSQTFLSSKQSWISRLVILQVVSGSTYAPLLQISSCVNTLRLIDRLSFESASPVCAHGGEYIPYHLLQLPIHPPCLMGKQSLIWPPVSFVPSFLTSLQLMKHGGELAQFSSRSRVNTNVTVQTEVALRSPPNMEGK